MFQKKTVDGVLAGFKKIVADLDAITEMSQAKANDCTDEIARLHDERSGYIAEATRARTAADKISQLLATD